MNRRAPLLALLAACLFAQLPLLLRPEVNSDNAVVGLQALHFLRGEFSPWCWGTPYRSSIDALLTAIAFLFVGSRPLALLLVPIAGHLLLVSIAYRLLHRHLPGWSAAACCTPLVFLTLGPLLAILSGTREWSIVAALAALLLLDGGAALRAIVRAAVGSDPRRSGALGREPARALAHRRAVAARARKARMAAGADWRRGALLIALSLRRVQRPHRGPASPATGRRIAWASSGPTERRFRAEGVPVERFDAGGRTALVIRREVGKLGR